MPVELLVPQHLRDQHIADREAYHDHPVVRPSGHMNLRGLRKDGTEFAVDVSLSPIRAGDETYVLVSMRDITDRQRLEQERNELIVELETERERHRIGMDLHDGIMQEVYAVGLSLEIALEDLEVDTASTRHSIETAIDQLHDVIRDIRSYIFDLRPRQLNGSLSKALSDLVQEFRQNSQIDAETSIEVDLGYLSEETSNALYHIVHEALSNVRKHARAHRVFVQARPEADHVLLTIQDDGSGFDVDLERPERHRGVRNMQARATAAGAQLRIESAPGHGTTIVAILPPPSGQAGLRRVA
jgi:signal transduction histidine kinase